ncbi:MAG: hypothetical protein U0Q03_04915 [Acidimicrobiales bacterium]
MSQNLDTDLKTTLAWDSARTVRRAVFRHQQFDLDALLGLLRSGVDSTRLHEQLRLHVADPTVTRRLLKDRTTWWWAAGGSIDHRTFAEVFSELPPWMRQHLARTCRFERRDLVKLSRDADRDVQEAVGGRADLSPVDRRAIARRGHVWARAAVVAAAEPGSRVPRRLRFRRHRVIRRVVAAREQNQLLLWWWSTSAPWDVACAIASNPNIGRRTIRQLTSRERAWSVSEVLARREDVPEFAQRLNTAPPVLLALATNPAAPPWAIEHLVRSPDPYVRGQATGHPAAPVEMARAKLVDPATPVWVVRRAAQHPDLDEDERDAALAWLALGGGTGDPNFDPITCRGNPDITRSVVAAFEDEARREGLLSPLWRGRERWTHQHQSLGYPSLRAMASDSHVAVRRRAASFRWRSLLQELVFDADRQVAATARRTLDDPALSVAARWRPNGAAFLKRAAPVIIGGSLAVVVSVIGSVTSDPPERSAEKAAAQIESLPDTLKRTALVSYDDRCVIEDAALAVGRDGDGTVGFAFTAGRNVQILAGFSQSGDDQPTTAMRASAGETVTIVITSSASHVTLVQRGSASPPRVSELAIGRGFIDSEDCP